MTRKSASVLTIERRSSEHYANTPELLLPLLVLPPRVLSALWRNY